VRGFEGSELIIATFRSFAKTADIAKMSCEAVSARGKSRHLSDARPLAVKNMQAHQRKSLADLPFPLPP
jgi:hypothetical protein